MVFVPTAKVWRYAELQINLLKIVRIKEGKDVETGAAKRPASATDANDRDKRRSAEVIDTMVKLAFKDGRRLTPFSPNQYGRGHKGFEEARQIDAFNNRTIRHNGAPVPEVLELVRVGALLELDLSRQSSIKVPEVYNALAEVMASPSCRLRKLIVAAEHSTESYGDAPAIAILRNLPKGLTLLSLASFDIHLQGALALAAALKKTPLLRSLDLYSNKRIPVAGWKAIADALPSTLMDIDLYECNLPEKTRRLLKVGWPRFPDLFLPICSSPGPACHIIC